MLRITMNTITIGRYREDKKRWFDTLTHLSRVGTQNEKKTRILRFDPCSFHLLENSHPHIGGWGEGHPLEFPPEIR